MTHPRTIEPCTCKRCFIEQPAADFPSAPRKKNGLSSYCKKCTSSLSLKRWYKKQGKEDPHSSVMGRKTTADDGTFAVDTRGIDHRIPKDIRNLMRPNHPSGQVLRSLTQALGHVESELPEHRITYKDFSHIL